MGVIRQNKSRRGHGLFILSVTLYALGFSMGVADITLDGSLGGPRGPLSGSDYVIRADMGQQVDTNLFHSFGEFNLFNGQSATFTGEGATGAINNILSRVTGGAGSTIDGLLRSTIPGANLFLINPAGIMFGANARLDVKGSFHAGTADFIRLEDGVVFNAVPSPDDARLTTASPQAFGFLGEPPASLTVAGSELEVPTGETLSLVGGDIEIRGGEAPTVKAEAGQVNLAALASGGEINLTPGLTTGDPQGELQLTEGPRSMSAVTAEGPCGSGRDSSWLRTTQKSSLTTQGLRTPKEASTFRPRISMFDRDH
jgi:filamentous hemagglutinin family protein